jgi:hypothetical protein
MKPITFAGLMGLALFLFSACGQDGRLTEASIDQFEKEYRVLEDTLTYLNEVLQTNILALSFPFTGGRGQGGVIDLVEEYQYPNPLESLPDDRQIKVKSGFAGMNEKLNDLNTRMDGTRNLNYTIFNDLGRLRAALTNDEVDQEIKDLNADVRVRLDRLKTESSALHQEIQDAQQRNMSFLQSDEALQPGYSWLLASTPML